jgi:hypothetical protein
VNESDAKRLLASATDDVAAATKMALSQSFLTLEQRLEFAKAQALLVIAYRLQNPVVSDQRARGQH